MFEKKYHIPINDEEKKIMIQSLVEMQDFGIAALPFSYDATS